MDRHTGEQNHYYKRTENQTPGPEVIKLFFMLNSFEHEILNAHKYKNIKKFSCFKIQISRERNFSCS